jgi:3-hydroxyisobutyrate dehydrogenase
MSHVTVIGAGLLGAGMVHRLAENGHQVAVWNRSPAKAEALRAVASPAADPAAAVAGAAFIHLLLPEDDAVDAVLDAAARSISPEAWVLDHCTNLPARVAARRARLQAAGLRYLHAPVFMGPPDTRAGTGLMLIAGPADEIAAVQGHLAGLTGKLWHVGPRPDLAAIYKLCGNAVIIGMSGLMGDVLSIGEAQGLSAPDTLALFDVFKPGGALVPFAQRIGRAASGPPSFALEMAQKDVRLMIEAAQGPDGLVVLPAVAAAMQAAADQGHGARDYAIFARPRALRG